MHRCCRKSKLASNSSSGSLQKSRSLRGGQTQRGSNLHTTYMDSQRAAGQGEAKAQQNLQPQVPPMGAWGCAAGRWRVSQSVQGVSRRIAQNQLRPQNQLRKQCMDSQRAAGQGEAKAQQNPQPQAPPMAPGGARRAPCGFWSALSHRLGRPRAANPRAWSWLWRSR